MVVLDYLTLLFSLELCHLIYEFTVVGVFPQESFFLWFCFLAFIFAVQFIILYIFDLYNDHKRFSEFFKTHFFPLQACNLAIFTLVAVFCYWTKFSLGRDVILTACFIQGVLLVCNRLLATQVFSEKYLALVKPKPTIILNKGPLGELLSKEQAFLKTHYLLENDLPEENFIQSILELGVQTVVVDSTGQEKLKDKQIDDLIELKFKGLQVIDAASLFERLTNRLPLLHLTGKWLLNTQIFSDVRDQIVLRAKRLFDLALVILSLPVVLPLLAVASLLIKLTSKGPIIYSQSRVGLGGKVFTIYKLRSMVHSSDESLKWTTENDSRITPLGKLLRSLRIDELPQLFNIWMGDMSLIGPRPERPEYVNNLRKEIPYYDLRHSVRPGVTGWAQVNQPLASPNESLEKLEFDLFYIRNLSLWLEIDIILKTIRVVLLRRGL